ncbi:hypothetical protein ACHAW6_009557 [Cyclotella cf. meneghiniana]
MVTVEGLDKADEIFYYITRRYISACQGYWRSAKFDIVKMEPPVIRLPIHLPGQQIVLYSPNKMSVQAALERNKRTMLISWFVTMQQCENDCNLEYEDIQERYSWSADERMRTEHQRVFGRMVSISPSLGSATDNGELYPDFKDACIALGLCEDDCQRIEDMAEAVQISHPFVIQELFCNILLNCNPTNPRTIFEQLSSSMREGFVKHREGILNLTDDEVEIIAFNDLLHAINNTLEDRGKTNSYFGIDMPSETEDSEEIIDEAEFDPQAQSFFDECSPLSNEGQQSVFDTIKTHIDNKEGGLYNIDAPGGSGKTFLANVILAYVRKDNHIALPMAMSGIAATLLKLGTTFQRRIGVPIPCTSDSSFRIKLNSKQACLIRECIVFIIDEVSMMNFKLLGLLDRFLQELMGNNEYLGVKLIILMHDFHQILPVIPQDRRADIMAAAVSNSKIWTQFKPLCLRQKMRVCRMVQLNTSPDHDHKLQEYSN